MELLTLGKIQGLFGINGWIKVYSWTEPKENIFKYTDWYLDFDENASSLSSESDCFKYKLKQGKKHKNGLIASLLNVDDANSASCLVGAYVKIDRNCLPLLEEGEYYWQDLIGLQVLDLNGEVLGVVSNLMQTGANDCLIVKPSNNSIDNRERILPYLKPEVIKIIDLNKSIIAVDWDKDF